MITAVILELDTLRDDGGWNGDGILLGIGRLRKTRLAEWEILKIQEIAVSAPPKEGWSFSNNMDKMNV